MENTISKCRDCGAPIIWLKTLLKNKNIPVNAETVTDNNKTFNRQCGHICHFDTCPVVVAAKKEKELVA